MKRRQSIVFVVGIVAGLVGCEDEAGRWLAMRQKQVDLEFTQKMEVIQSLNELRHQLEELEKELAALRAQRVRPGPEELSRLLAGEPLTTQEFKPEGDVLHVRLGGAGGAPRLLSALRALGRAEQTLVLKQVSVEPSAWTAELELPPDPSLAVKKKVRPSRAPYVPKPLPEPGLFETATHEKQREKIRETEKKIAELDRVIDELRKLRERQEASEAQLRALKELKPERQLVGQRPIVEALFGGPRPKLTTGVARFQEDRLELRNLGRGDAARRRASLEAIGPVLEADADFMVIGLTRPTP